LGGGGKGVQVVRRDPNEKNDVNMLIKKKLVSG